MNMNVHAIASALGATISCDSDFSVHRVSIDSRTTQPGDLFFCIVGQKLDGHEFARQAVNNGACAVVASTPLELDVPVILVRDTTQALGRLARTWREQTTARVIGVTGSAGKTTVKEMLAQVLGVAGKTGRNFRNLNNQIGLPLSILDMHGDEDFWVLEMGISRPGDMDELGSVLVPDAALILNVGPCHLEGLGSLANVAAQKSILLDYVRPGGFACVNADQPELVAESAKRAIRQASFSGSGASAQYSCLCREGVGESLIYTVRTRTGDVQLQVSNNVHVAENVAAVTAMAMELGLSAREIAQGLGAYVPVGQRFVRTQVGSWLLIDDTYNANPVSMSQSIREAERLANGKELVLVLADMRELGKEAASAHRQMGHLISETKTSYCLFHGRHALDVHSGLGDFPGMFVPVDTTEEMQWVLSPLRAKGGVVLFKGSRSCNMERFFSVLERTWV